METVKKIAVIGPESTGKSTLCQKLAVHYQTSLVPEYAREYLETYGTDYTYEDLLKIAKGQISLEEDALKKLQDEKHHLPLFIDTNLYVMKVWSEYVFNNCHNWILNRIAERKYDLYLLCDVDLPWIKDKLREYPDAKIRRKLFHFYKELMISQSTPWCTISGNYAERMEKAIQFIDGSFT